MPFSKVYECYILKAEKKNRKKFEVDKIICWLLGYKKEELEDKIKNKITIEDFILNAPKLNPLRKSIKGTICGVKIEEIKNPIMKEIRYLDKLIDELSKGKPLEMILEKFIK